MKRVTLLVVFVAIFAMAANAQRFGNSTCGLIPGPCMERAARQAYAPVDYMINNGYGPYGGYDYPIGYGGYGGLGYGYGYGGYGYYGRGRIGTSAIVGGIAGAITGGLVAYAATRNGNGNRTTYVTASNGGQYYAEPRREVRFAEPKRQKPLDCSKPAGKRGRNEAACAAAEQEMKATDDEAKHQACLADLATSSWQIRNFSPVATVYPTISSQPLLICGEQAVLQPLQTIHIFPPDGQVGGYFFFAHSSGKKMRAEAKVQAVNEPGFTGFILTVPGPPKGGN